MKKQNWVGVDVGSRELVVAVERNGKRGGQYIEGFILDPVNPFASGGPGDLISVTQLAHRPLAACVVAVKLLTLF